MPTTEMKTKKKTVYEPFELEIRLKAKHNTKQSIYLISALDIE